MLLKRMEVLNMSNDNSLFSITIPYNDYFKDITVANLVRSVKTLSAAKTPSDIEQAYMDIYNEIEVFFEEGQRASMEELKKMAISEIQRIDVKYNG